MSRTTPPTRWRLVPTITVVLTALVLGAASARADAPALGSATPGGTAAAASHQSR